ncbi:peptide transporter ptr2 [Didymella heteroderae]|uniref:Peptide transporter ptr2 n=1 Tax=Didymella heteroderae TaxID=1769908 RepID=A0A9P4WG25_9PLEO|nr:peptide transporter ptr2 [Didymella heteroderae]
MFLIGIEGGSFRAGIVPFIADQYTAITPRLEMFPDSDGTLVEVDGVLTLQYIYNVYYWAGNVGSLSWIATVYLEKRVGFAASYGLGMALIAIATAFLVAGRQHLVKAPHNRAVVSPSKDLNIATFKAGFRLYEADPTYQLENHRRQVSWSTELFADVSKTIGLLRML